MHQEQFINWEIILIHLGHLLLVIIYLQLNTFEVHFKSFP